MVFLIYHPTYTARDAIGSGFTGATQLLLKYLMVKNFSSYSSENLLDSHTHHAASTTHRVRFAASLRASFPSFPGGQAVLGLGKSTRCSGSTFN